MRATKRRCWTTCAVILAVVSTACGGGGGGGGGGGPTQPPPTPGINFTPARSASLNSVYLQEGADSTVNRLFLQVRTNDVQFFYGVAFDLVYPSGQLNYEKVTENGFLGSKTSLQVVESAPGRLVVGHTILGANVGKTGSGILMTFEFTAAANGSGSFTFEDEQAFQPGALPQAVDFIAGSVSVQR